MKFSKRALEKVVARLEKLVEGWREKLESLEQRLEFYLLLLRDFDEIEKELDDDET